MFHTIGRGLTSKAEPIAAQFKRLDPPGRDKKNRTHIHTHTHTKHKQTNKQKSKCTPVNSLDPLGKKKTQGNTQANKKEDTNIISLDPPGRA